MLRRLAVFALLLATFASALTAQSDPRARKDLEALKAAYEGGDGLQADVTLEIQFPEQPAEVQTGTIAQQGDQFRIEFDQQVVISDGATVWMYLPDNREVQIYDATEAAAGSGFMRPQDVLNIYEDDRYEYAIVGDVTEDGRTFRQIEFKPLADDTEYFKVRLTYDAAKQEVRRIRVFNHDGSRFALNLTQVKSGSGLAANTFTFDAAKYPGVSVEDMRL